MDPPYHLHDPGGAVGAPRLGVKVALGVAHGHGEREGDVVLVAVVHEGDRFPPGGKGLDVTVLVKDVKGDDGGVFLVGRVHAPEPAKDRLGVFHLPLNKIFGFKVHFL